MSGQEHLGLERSRVSYMTPEQAAAYLGIRRKTLYGYIRAGALQVHRLGTGPKPRIMIDDDQIRRFLTGEGDAPDPLERIAVALERIADAMTGEQP